jgi:beta-lactamase regulating signal transducer with metallopeptidase domain/tetratricopeptide (TPR) repeat protein
MDILSFMLNKDLASLLITLAGQSILISFIGLIVIKVLSKRSAPLRSLVCSVTMIALGLTLVISIGFYLKDISWYQATLSFVIETNTKNSILLTSDQNTNPFSEIRALPLKARSQTSVEKNITIPASGTSSHPDPFVLPVFHLINIAGLFWLTGILYQMLRLGYGILSVKKFRNSLQSSKCDHHDKMLQAVARRFWKKRLPKLYSSPLIKSPVTVGLFNPVVIIPQRLTSIITENEMKSILLHELAHIYHYDHVAGVIKRFVMAIHWWNPFVYQINRHHEQAREEVSDNYVLRELQPKAYSQCLMDLTEKVCLISSYPTAVSMAGKHFSLRKRVEQILSKKRRVTMGTKFYIRAIIFSLFLVLVFGVAGLQGKIQAKTTYLSQRAMSVMNSSSIPEEEINISREDTAEQNLKKSPENLKEVSGIQEKAPNKQAVENVNSTVSTADTGIKTAEEPEKKSEFFKAIQGTVLSTDAKDSIVLAKRDAPMKIDSNTSDDQKSKGDVTEIENTATHIPQGISSLKNGQIEDVASDFKSAIELEPGNASNYVMRGIAYQRLNKLENAISDYNKAIKLNPELDVAYQNRGSAYFQQGQFDKAISDYNKALELNPEDSVAYTSRGTAYFSIKKYGKAFDDFNRAIELNPRNANAFINRGTLFHYDRKYDMAAADYKKALELNPKSASSERLKRYCAWVAKRRAEGVESNYRYYKSVVPNGQVYRTHDENMAYQ